jgi:hypothetical protein
MMPGWQREVETPQCVLLASAPGLLGSVCCACKLCYGRGNAIFRNFQKSTHARACKTKSRRKRQFKQEAWA